jgi:DNA repair photolyase
MLITPFDPWESKLCTCPQKLTLNPYTGCPHGCLYCYVTSYIPNFHHCRPKKELTRKVEKEATKLEGNLISIANSSDPYPPIEETLGITRTCLQTLSKHDCKIQIVTKSPLVTRDIDILRKTPSMVSITITTENDEIAKLLEPSAPLPSKRLKALCKLLQNNIPTTVRIDPIIPYLNNQPEKLVKELASMGVPQITCSTYKVKYDNWRRFTQAFPTKAIALKPLYFEIGEQHGRSFLLPREMRKEILENVKEVTENEGMRFSSCREGFPQLNSATCDGSWLLYEQ